jgi:hypothetical protein
LSPQTNPRLTLLAASLVKNAKKRQAFSLRFANSHPPPFKNSQLRIKRNCPLLMLIPPNPVNPGSRQKEQTIRKNSIYAPRSSRSGTGVFLKKNLHPAGSIFFSKNLDKRRFDAASRISLLLFLVFFLKKNNFSLVIFTYIRVHPLNPRYPLDLRSFNSY